MKLNQIIAVEKGVKSRDHSEVTSAYHLLQKPELFNGITKTFRKKVEEGEDYPADRKRVNARVEDLLNVLRNSKRDLLDTTATKDYANCNAFADVVVDGRVVVEKAPVAYLLFLEKQVTDVIAFFNALPVLDESEDWSFDENSGLHKTKESQTAKTKKVQRPMVLYPATPEHPAQTQLVTEDVIEGYWDNVKYSGAMPLPRKKELIRKAQVLLDAVKRAREEANAADAPKKNVGEAIFNFLLN